MSKPYTVKTGDNLWSLAMVHYGSGSQYPKIVRHIELLSLLR